MQVVDDAAELRQWLEDCERKQSEAYDAKKKQYYSSLVTRYAIVIAFLSTALILVTRLIEAQRGSHSQQQMETEMQQTRVEQRIQQARDAIRDGTADEALTRLFADEDQ